MVCRGRTSWSHPSDSSTATPTATSRGTAFTRYLPEEFQDRAILPVRNGKGEEVILAGGRVATFNSESGLGFDMAYRPGSLKEMLKQMGSGNPDETYQPEPIRPEYLERAPRLELMAKQGVEKCVLFPAGMALAAEHYCDDTEALYANLRSFNRWYDETWGFDREDRLFATACCRLRDLDAAVAETDAILADGARVVLLPTGPAYGRSPGDPYFDPVWSRLNEAGVTIALHIMPFWYFDAISPAWGHDPTPARGTCRRGSGTTSTASAPSRTHSRRSSSTTCSVGFRTCA